MAESPSGEMRAGAAELLAAVAALRPEVVPTDVIALLDADTEKAVLAAVALAKPLVAAVDDDRRRTAYAAFSAF